MDALSCPKCGTGMSERPVGDSQVSVCPEGHGVFLDRADLGALVEAEADWHRTASFQTAPIPRITPDMVAPPAAARSARAWVETLFG